MKFPAINMRCVTCSRRSNDVYPINQIEYYKPRPRFSRDSCLEANLAGDRPTVVVQRKMVEIEMIEIERVVCSEPAKSLYLIIVNSRRFSSCPTTALSMDKVFGPGVKVKVLISTIVRLYLVRPPFARVVLCAIR